MPKIAYIDKTFRDDELELIGIANGIAAEYEAQGYGLTLRRLYCQMVSRDIIPNNIRSYKNLGSLINDARLAGLVDWHAICEECGWEVEGAVCGSTEAQARDSLKATLGAPL